MIEIWEDIKEYEGLYQISNYGRVKSMPKLLGHRPKSETILKNKINVHGYPFVGLCKDGKYKWKTIHRLVALHFLSNPHNKPQINHIDGDPLNTHLSNFEWTSQSENMIHSYYKLENKGVINRPIEQLDLNGNLISVHISIQSVKRTLGISSATSVYYACLDKNKTAYSCKWRFKD